MTALPPLPVITSVTPTAGAEIGGMAITVTGSGFEPVGTVLTGGVMVGAKACLAPRYNNNRQILCQVQNGTRGVTEPVSVTLYGRTSHPNSAAQFTYDSACIPVNVTGGGTAWYVLLTVALAAFSMHLSGVVCASCSFQCEPGTYLTAAQTTVCANCTAGTFAFGYGQTTCDPCGPGSYAPSIGASVCVDCAPGSASTGTGAAQCTLCLAGTFAETPGQFFCPPVRASDDP